MELLAAGLALAWLLSGKSSSATQTPQDGASTADTSPPKSKGLLSDALELGGKLGANAGNLAAAGTTVAGGIAAAKAALSGGGAAAAGAAKGAGLAAGSATILGKGTAGVAGAGTAAAGAAATAALVAATGALGYGITGQPSGAVGSVVNLALQLKGGTGIVQAQTGAVGTVLGRELDKLFNGDVASGTRTLFEVGGYVVGVAIGMQGLLVVPVIGQWVALVLAIGGAISELNRLAYGQAGATSDAYTEAKRFYDNTLAGLQAASSQYINDNYPGPLSKLVKADPAYLRAVARWMTEGWFDALTLSREKTIMSAPGPVLFQGPARVQWAIDRGLYLNGASLGTVRAALDTAAQPGPITAESRDAAYAAGKYLCAVGLYLKTRDEPRGNAFMPMIDHLRYWKDRGAFACDEVFADGQGDSIRIGNVWVLGNDSARDGAIRTYPA